MADCYTALAEYSVSPPEGIAVSAKSAALRALEIDDTLAEAHASLGYIKIVYDWDWHGAEADFKRAIELNPQHAPAHHRYAYTLTFMGRYAEGLQEIRRAQELAPHSIAISKAMGHLLCTVGDYDSAIEELERALEMDPGSFLTHLLLGVTYLYKSMYDEALAAFREEDRILGGRSPHAAAMIGVTHALSGNVDEAERTLVELKELSKHQPVSPALIAFLCFTLERRDEGFDWLEKAYEERDLMLRQLVPVFRTPEFVGGDPRFIDLLEKMGLES